MFIGVNPISLDDKGRMAIPTRYRPVLLGDSEGRVVVTADRDRCLALYPGSEWGTIERKLARLPSLNRQAQAIKRLTLGYATECELDGSGRILISTALREFAGMQRDVVLVGQGHKFEIWDAAVWSQRRDVWLEGLSKDEDLPPELQSLSL